MMGWEVGQIVRSITQNIHNGDDHTISDRISYTAIGSRIPLLNV